MGAEGGLGAFDRYKPYLDLLREMSGPAERPPPATALLGWEGGTLAKLACDLYLRRDWEGIPILGDALEEAGCTDVEVLEHCRTGGPHARGCWVIDWIKGWK